ncbi:MAG: inositol monophosphatase family protein [Ilumatobacteraceae bacterium]
MDHVTDDDHAVAAELAEEAGALLLALRSSGVAEADELKALGDRRSHDLLMDRLARRRPDDAVLSEEGVADPARLTARRVWIVDPLDGTREFGEDGRVDWAVHVALVVGGVPVVGAVALPGLGEVWSTGRPLPVVAGQRPTRPRVTVSRTRPGAAAAALGAAMDHELVPMGSAGAKAISVLRGDADIYAHTGGQYEWDSAAPVAVVVANGIGATRIDGSPLVYNRADPYLPDLLITYPTWTDAALAALVGVA